MSQTGESKVTKEPQLVFLSNPKNPTGSNHIFGDIPQGKPVTAEFAFVNKGQDPLIISEVKPTCGCTIADYTKLPVKSGDKGVIKLTFNAAVATSFDKSIAVLSNATPADKPFFIHIKGNVVGAPSTEPAGTTTTPKK
jgi:hypothetical protein